MSDQVLRGSCLCKAVRFEVRPPFLRFIHCYCSRCRKATGGVRATNIALLPDQFRWISGEELISRYDLPEARALRDRSVRAVTAPCRTDRATANKSSFPLALWMMNRRPSRLPIASGEAGLVGSR